MWFGATRGNCTKRRLRRHSWRNSSNILSIGGTHVFLSPACSYIAGRYRPSRPGHVRASMSTFAVAPSDSCALIGGYLSSSTLLLNWPYPARFKMIQKGSRPSVPQIMQCQPPVSVPFLPLNTRRRHANLQIKSPALSSSLYSRNCPFTSLHFTSLHFTLNHKWVVCDLHVPYFLSSSSYYHAYPHLCPPPTYSPLIFQPTLYTPVHTFIHSLTRAQVAAASTLANRRRLVSHHPYSFYYPKSYI